MLRDTQHANNTTSPTTLLRRDAEDSAAMFPALMVEAEKIAASLMTGIHGRRQSGQGETFWQHRPYDFGDSLAMIDWRQSARSADRLYVRQNEWEAAASVWVWRDPTNSMVYASAPSLVEKRYRANVLAIAASILLAHGGERLGVLTGDRHNGSTRLFHGRGAPTRVLEHLDHRTIETEEAMPFSDKIRAGNKVVLYSDFLIDPDHVGEGLHRLTSIGATGVVCQVLDPAEKTFPFRGRKEFLDTESEDRLLFGNAGALKKAYDRQFQVHQSHLKTVSSQTGWPLITHYTDEHPRHALLPLIDALAPARR